MSFRNLFAKTPAEVKALDNLSEYDRTVRIPAIKAALQADDADKANGIMKDWIECCYGGIILPNWTTLQAEMRAIWTGSDLGAYPKCLK